MFRGNHPARVDEKGRLKIPADFKREFPEKQEFYVTSLDGKRAQLYPIAEWEKKEEVLAKMPSTSVAKIKFLDVTSYYGQMVEMDTQGRCCCRRFCGSRPGWMAKWLCWVSRESWRS